MASSYDAAKANAEAQKRGALSALAQGGSQGLAAYNQAISQVGAGRQQALQAATARSNLIGGPEAAVSNYSAPINAAGNEAISGLQTNRGALGNYFNQLKSANTDYFNKVSAATPIEELAQLRALANRGGSNSTSGASFQNKVIGTALNDVNQAQQKQATESQQNQAKLNNAVQFNKSHLVQAQDLQKGYAQQLRTDIAAQKAGNRDPAIKQRVVNTLQALDQLTNQQKTYKTNLAKGAGLINPSQKTRVPDPFDAARQEAVNQGMDPNEAQVVFSRSNPTVARKLVTNSSAYLNGDKSLNQYINSGATRTEIMKVIDQVATTHPLTAKYLLEKYKSQLPTLTAKEKIASGQILTYAEKKQLGLVK